MLQIKLKDALPESDGSTSTNYGPTFEIFSTAIFVLRCCKQNKQFHVWINHKPYEPWDDIVAKIDNEMICVQLKHNIDLDNDKLEKCLKAREMLSLKHPNENITYVYFATTPDNAIRQRYCELDEYPNALTYLLTKKNAYYDPNSQFGDTYLCMNQQNATKETAEVKQAIADYFGKSLLSNDLLAEIKTVFLEYLRLRYLRLIKNYDPLTDEEIRLYLSYTILSRFKVDYQLSSKLQVSNNFQELTDNASVLVLNHKWSSKLRDCFWNHVMWSLENKVAKKHLKQGNLDQLWYDGKFHMPIESSTKESDKIIARALEIANFQPKVIILRAKVFSIAPKQDVITLLQNLNVAETTVWAKTGDEVEHFKYASVDVNSFGNKSKLHQDVFAKVAKEYFKLSGTFFEAHDEHSYINDTVKIDDVVAFPAIFAALQIKNIDIKIIRHLIDLGANVDATIIGGIKPIFCAISENRVDILKLLLEKHANVNVADKDGMQPLFFTCIQNRIEMVALLVKYGANRNAADVDGVRPLFMAYHNGNFEIIRILLTDFDVDSAAAANTQGIHLLHQAAEDGSVECLKCVLECSRIQRFMTGDVRGKTPLEIAREKGHSEFANMLNSALQE